MDPHPDLPLAHVPRPRRGRPPKGLMLRPDGHSKGTAPPAEAVDGQELAKRRGARVLISPAHPRLLDLENAAKYLGVSGWTVRDLVDAGLLQRIRLPLPGGGELRKILLDRHDLDAWIERMKDRA